VVRQLQPASSLLGVGEVQERGLMRIKATWLSRHSLTVVRFCNAIGVQLTPTAGSHAADRRFGKQHDLALRVIREWEMLS